MPNAELAAFDAALGWGPQVVVLNKVDIIVVCERGEELLARMQETAGHSRVLPISTATTERVGADGTATEVRVRGEESIE